MKIKSPNSTNRLFLSSLKSDLRVVEFKNVHQFYWGPSNTGQWLLWLDNKSPWGTGRHPERLWYKTGGLGKVATYKSCTNICQSGACRWTFNPRQYNLTKLLQVYLLLLKPWTFWCYQTTQVSFLVSFLQSVFPVRTVRIGWL